MKYRTKLYLFFLAISLISIIASLSLIVFESRNVLFGQLQSKIVSVAAGAATDLDPNLVKEIQTKEDEGKPAYQKIIETLRAHRNANRRDDLYVKYLYITRPDPNNPQKFIFVIDSEERKEEASPFGQSNPKSTEDFLQNHLKEPYSYPKLTQDQWGIWLTGYHPIYDLDGNYLGTVGADISALEVHQTINRLFIYSLGAFLLSLVLAMLAAAFLAKHATKALVSLQMATKEIAKPNFEYRVDLKTNDEFEELASSLNQMCEQLQEKEKLKIGFAHYVSKHVLERIIKEKGATKLEGEKRKITVLFSDIRGFTRIAEQFSPEEVVKLLNEYFKVMLEVIFKHNGMLDKLVGDGIMAEFGAPIDDPEQEKNAVLTAIEMVEKLKSLNEKWRAEGKPTIDIGVGVHTGEAIVGSVGTEERMEYTAIGDTVNIASRLQVISKEKKLPIIISESTYKPIKHQFSFEEIGPVTLQGRVQSIKVFTIK